jgi:PAS domain S-box-containing protein
VTASAALRALLVEDDPADAELTRLALERAGVALSADTAATQDEFAARLATARYDVVLSDYRLRGWTAMDALALLRDRGHDTPLIVVTGTLGDERAVECVKGGAADYVTKDNLARLPVAVRRALEEVALRRAQRASEERYERLFHSVPLPIWVFDVETHRVLAVNDAAVARHGYTRDECLALHIEQLSVPEALPALRAHLARMPVGPHAAGTWRQRTKDGRVIVVEVTGFAMSWAGRRAELAVMHDVTAREDAERALREREERFRQLADNIREVFFVMAADYSETLYVSPAFEDIWGLPVDHVYDDPRAFLAPIPPEDRDRLVADIARIRQTGEPAATEFRVTRPGGDVRWLLGRAVPVRDEHGAVYRVAGVALDITDRKLAQAAVAERVRVAELVGEIGVALTGGTGLRQTLHACCAAVVKHLDAAFARIWTLNESEQVLELQASAGRYTRVDGTHSRVPVGQLKIGLIARERRPHVTNAVIGDPLVHDQAWAKREGMVAFAGYPLVVDDRVVGVLAMFATHSLAPFAERALASVADPIAVGIERRRGEQRIRELTVAVDHGPAAVVMTDADGVIEYVNHRFTEITGYAPGEALGRKPSLVKSGNTPDTVYRDLWHTITRGAVGRGEIQNRRKSGELYWAEASISPLRDGAGRIAKFIAVQEDVTERKQAEAALRLSEERLRTLFETVNLIVLGLDATGRIEYVNPFLLALTGYTEEGLLGQDWIERCLPAARRAEMRGVFAELVERGIPAHYQNPIVTKAGKERMIAWHNTLLRDAAGRCTGTLSIGEDVTEHLHLEQQFRQAQKMEAVGRLAGGVAHDFNNLLTAILGGADLALEEMAPDAPGRADLEEIRKASVRAAALTRQLLAFSRQQVLEPRVLDLNELVQEMEKLLRRLIGEDISLRTVLAPDLGAVRADPGQLEQVIANLVVNARDAMPRGGRLTIETTDADLDARYGEEHAPVTPGPYVMLAISDTGTGMDADTKARIFEPFFTTKQQGKGTGLGLSTVYGIVKQSGGYIWVYSEAGQGATFKVYLPRIAATPQPLERAAEGAVRGGTETVLVVEDEAQVGDLTRRILEAQGYRVLIARDGGTALELVRTRSDPIHLLVTDVVMPGMSGRALAVELLRQRPDLKVLYLSGYAPDAVVQHGVLEPGTAFLQKPFTAATLSRKVRAELDAR